MHALIHTYIIIIIKGPYTFLYTKKVLYPNWSFRKKTRRVICSKQKLFQWNFEQTFLTALFLTLDATGMGLNNSAW